MSSKKRNHSPNVDKVTCDKCGMEAMAPADTKHRRCPGEVGMPLRECSMKIEPARRGTWKK